MKAKGNGYRHTGKYLSPSLTEEQKLKRMLWCRDREDETFDWVIDIDEKVII